MNWLPEWSIIGIASYIIIGMIRMFVIFVIGFTLKDKAPKVIVAPIFIFGFIYDIFLNWWLTIVFLDLPDEWDETITNRMKRYKLEYMEYHWKHRFAVWLCHKLNRRVKGHC